MSCTPQPDRSQVIENPVVVFEVLSESTSRTDRIEKVREYRATPSILRCVILEQDSIGATIFVRNGQQWSTISDKYLLHMPEIGVEFGLQELYPSSARENFGSHL